jgi:hypothetical protein
MRSDAIRLVKDGITLSKLSDVLTSDSKLSDVLTSDSKLSDVLTSDSKLSDVLTSDSKLSHRPVLIFSYTLYKKLLLSIQSILCVEFFRIQGMSHVLH